MERLRVAVHSTALIPISPAARAEPWGTACAALAVPVSARATIVFSGRPAARPAAEPTHGP